MDSKDSGLNEQPLEFFQSMANTGGYCDGQAILPDGDKYRVFCSCGEWEVEAPSQEEGLLMARIHTGSVPAP